jgi:hypothetical protein
MKLEQLLTIDQANVNPEAMQPLTQIDLAFEKQGVKTMRTFRYQNQTTAAFSSF